MDITQSFCPSIRSFSIFLGTPPVHQACARAQEGPVQVSALLQPVSATSPEIIKLRRDKCNEVRGERESSRGHRGSPSRAAPCAPVLSTVPAGELPCTGATLGRGPCGRWGSRNPGVDLPRVRASCQEVMAGEHSWAGPGLQTLQSTLAGRALTQGSLHPPGPPRTMGQCFPQAGPVWSPWFGVACASPRQG